MMELHDDRHVQHSRHVRLHLVTQQSLQACHLFTQLIAFSLSLLNELCTPLHNTSLATRVDKDCTVSYRYDQFPDGDIKINGDGNLGAVDCAPQHLYHLHVPTGLSGKVDHLRVISQGICQAAVIEPPSVVAVESKPEARAVVRVYDDLAFTLPPLLLSFSSSTTSSIQPTSIQDTSVAPG
ncbi:hypothetical protein OG21DRAFT_1527789 [Imleria badia]|nr:hypothetical protein OG21DRAFT_1527789 [Imleria badia]